MKRKVTAAEREILLEHPELVMFEPYKGMKTHRASLGKSLILPGATVLFFVAWALLFPDSINAHPTTFAATLCAMLVLSCGFLPILYFILDDREYKKAKATHYAKYLKMLLPQKLECNTALVQYVVVEKAEGGWIMDGEEGMFSYSSLVNYFRIEPDTEIAVLSDGKGFFAYVKREPCTESFYSE